MNRGAEKVVESLKASLLDVWEVILDELEKDLKELRADTDTQISTLRGKSDST